MRHSLYSTYFSVCVNVPKTSQQVCVSLPALKSVFCMFVTCCIFECVRGQDVRFMWTCWLCNSQRQQLHKRPYSSDQPQRLWPVCSASALCYSETESLCACVNKEADCFIIKTGCIKVCSSFWKPFEVEINRTFCTLHIPTFSTAYWPR